jgi:hypothetical protein
MALMAGFVMCLEMIEKEGLNAAREWLKIMSEEEDRLTT